MQTLKNVALGLALLATGVVAEDFPTERIHGTGPTRNRVHVLIVGDGWNQADLDTGNFKKAAKSVSDYLVARPPFKEYAHLINITRIDVRSTDSGVSHIFNNVNKNTYYGTQYPATTDVTGTATGDSRGLWFKDSNDAQKKIRETNPSLPRQVTVVLANDGTYGGAAMYSAGMCTVSTNSAANEVFFHELGHALMNLADEYVVAGETGTAPTIEPEEANVTIEGDGAKVKWKKWFAAGTTPTKHPCPDPATCPQKGVGLHEQAKYTFTGVWRPRENCLMRALNNPMCEPCLERSVKRFYENVTLVDKRTPTASTLSLQASAGSAGVAQTFSVDAVSGPDSKIEATWYIDGAEQPGTQSKTGAGVTFTFNAPADKLPPGSHLVRVLLRDKTQFLRQGATGSLPNFLSFLYYFLPNNTQWNVKVEAAGIIPRLRRILGW